MHIVPLLSPKFAGVRLYAEWLPVTKEFPRKTPRLTASFFDSRAVGDLDGAVYFQTVGGQKFLVEQDNALIAAYTRALRKIGGFFNKSKGDTYLNDQFSRCELWGNARECATEKNWLRFPASGEGLMQVLYNTTDGGIGRLRGLITEAFGLSPRADENNRSLFIDRQNLEFLAAKTIPPVQPF